MRAKAEIERRRRQAVASNPIEFGEWLPAVSPGLTWDWPHLTFIRQALAKLTAGEIRQLMLSVPPRHGKSEMVTVRYPVYRMERNPALRVIVGAYNQFLANKFSRKSRRLARGRFTLSSERAAVEEWETYAGGTYRAIGVGSGVTGQGGDLIIIDDPVKSRREAESPAYREAVWEWYTDDLFTRREPGAQLLLIQTRWHADDLAGRILQSEDAGNWTVINLPALAEDGDPLGRSPGEALCPARFDKAELAKIGRVLGSYGFSALYQGRPSPPEGGILKRMYWRFWGPKGIALPPVRMRLADGTLLEIPTVELDPKTLDEKLLSWDMTFKDTAGSDYVAGQVWGRRGADCFLLDQVHERLDFPATLAAFEVLTRRYPDALTRLVEDKANGPAVIAMLRHKIVGLVPVEPRGTKVARAQAITPALEAGNVYLPHPGIAPWVDGLVEEAASFPNGPHDDQVDALTQALDRLLLKQPGRVEHIPSLMD